MFINGTIAGLVRPVDRKFAYMYDICLILGGSLLVGLCAQVAIGWPIPITGQTFAVLMIGALFGSRRGALCMLVYLIEGWWVGLPVFAYGRAGSQVVLGPTGGYLIGFIAAAYVVGFLAERGWDRRVWTTVLAMFLGNVVIYAFGLFWLSCLVFLGKAAIAANEILAVGLYPCIIGDLVKSMLAAAVMPSGWKLLSMIYPLTKQKKDL